MLATGGMDHMDRKNYYRLATIFAQALSISGLLLSQTGCSTFQAQARVDPQTVAWYNPGDTTKINPTRQSADGSPNKRDYSAETIIRMAANPCPAKIDGDMEAGAINLDCFYFPEDNDKSRRQGAKTAYARAAELKTDQYLKADAAAKLILDNERIVLRNRLAEILFKRSTDICSLEMGRLVANEGTANVALTTLDSIFSTTSTIVSGTQAKSILSGLAGVANAGRSTVRAEIYRNTLAPAISRAITNERKKVHDAIEGKLSTKSANDYNVDQMIADINDYHQICSFYRGLTLVNDAIDAAKPPEKSTLATGQDALDLLDTRIAALEKNSGANTQEIATLKAQRADITKKLAEKLSAIEK